MKLNRSSCDKSNGSGRGNADASLCLLAPEHRGTLAESRETRETPPTIALVSGNIRWQPEEIHSESERGELP